MENNQVEQEQVASQVYEFAANQLIERNRRPNEVKNMLVQQGLDTESALIVVENLKTQINEAKKEGARKDMLYGALWCVGGIIATVSDIGYIFWGAILFGGFQFFRGVANSN